MGAPLGNKNNRKGKVWADAVERALSAKGQDMRTLLDAAAHALVQAALGGDVSALKEIGDRLDGKPSQSIDIDTSATIYVIRAPQPALDAQTWEQEQLERVK